MTTSERQKPGAFPLSEQTPKYLWRSGEFLPWATATVHITEIAWTAISAVFEGIRAYKDAVDDRCYFFRLDAHLRRFADSMKLMRLPQGFTAAELERAMSDLLRLNEIRGDAYVMPLAFFKGSVPGYRAVEEPTTEVLITARHAPSNLGTPRVLNCCISSWARISDRVMPPRAKCIANYQNSRLVATEAQLNGFDAGIILNEQGKVAEAGAACIFIVRQGTAITPPVTAGILESITRDALIRLLREVMQVPVVEREVDRTELYIAEEAFLCGTLMEITPIKSVDHYHIGSGEMGPITQALEHAFQDVVRGQDPRYAAWRTSA